MKKTFCDGPCGRELAPDISDGWRPHLPEVFAVIERIDGMHDARRPAHAHLCLDCTEIAFNALKPKEQ